MTKKCQDAYSRVYFSVRRPHTSQSFSANNGGPIAFSRVRFSRRTIFPDDFLRQNKSGTFTGAQHSTVQHTEPHSYSLPQQVNYLIS